MWIVIAIVAVLVLVLAGMALRRSPRVDDDVQRWRRGLDVLGRTAERPAVGGTSPRPDDAGEGVHVLGTDRGAAKDTGDA